VRPHTVRRPRLALGDGAATRVSFFGTNRWRVHSGDETKTLGSGSHNRGILSTLITLLCYLRSRAQVPEQSEFTHSG